MFSLHRVLIKKGSTSSYTFFYLEYLMSMEKQAKKIAKELARLRLKKPEKKHEND